MSVLEKLASALDRNDEEPNIELAEEIVGHNDTAAVQELVTHLKNPDKAVQADCIKVLYEVGYRQPELIADYGDNFVALLTHKNNRMVWGGMTALGSIAHLKYHELKHHLARIQRTTNKGSVITQDWGIRVLAMMAAKDTDISTEVFPFLTRFLRECRPKDVPRHAESIVIAVNSDNKDEFLDILHQRLGSLKPSQAKRVQKLIKKIESIEGAVWQFLTEQED